MTPHSPTSFPTPSFLCAIKLLRTAPCYGPGCYFVPGTAIKQTLSTLPPLLSSILLTRPHTSLIPCLKEVLFIPDTIHETLIEGLIRFLYFYFLVVSSISILCHGYHRAVSQPSYGHKTKGAGHQPEASAIWNPHSLLQWQGSICKYPQLYTHYLANSNIIGRTSKLTLHSTASYDNPS